MRLADRVQLVDPDWPSISRRFGAGIQAEIRSSETEKRRCALALVRLPDDRKRHTAIPYCAYILSKLCRRALILMRLKGFFLQTCDKYE